mmetsp:Transcript_111843/g.311265  ORF Transcript_111843/g.311265 Transcript_111843/m.311265 type:complete len:334 (-) Transcript_111843:152-1153(-)
MLLLLFLIRHIEARTVQYRHRGVDGLSLRRVSYVRPDPEPTVINATGGGGWARPGLAGAWEAQQALHAVKAGWLWPPSNAKNGTPWFRLKSTDDRGQASHSHFGGLRAQGDFDLDVLEAHNVVRSRAGILQLEWSVLLAGLASDRVHTLANEGCYIRHSPLEDRWAEAGFKYVGENLYKVINMAPTGVDIVDAWYAEIQDYSYGPVGSACARQQCAGRKTPPCTLGHFTQVMWAETTHVGCALAECPGQAKRTFVAVCNYGPGGNVVGRVPFPPNPASMLGLNPVVCTSLDASMATWPHSGGNVFPLLGYKFLLAVMLALVLVHSTPRAAGCT